MNEEEKYLFDLQGYIKIENVLDAATVAAMNGWIDRQAEENPAFQSQTGNTHLENVITWGPMFRNLMDHPRTLPVLRALMGDMLRLDHDYAIFLRPGHKGLELHGPTAYAPYDPCHYYHCINGQIFCGLCVATFALTDVAPGQGGLCLIPGSHKNNFVTPEDIRFFRRPSPIVQQIPTKAGDCVIFTEKLMHGTFPWQGPGERRTLFFKYAPPVIAWTNKRYYPSPSDPEIAPIVEELTETQRILLQPPSAKDFRNKIPPAE